MAGEVIRIHGGYNTDIKTDCSVNLNPLGMPEGCRRAVHDALDSLVRYPLVDHEVLIRELSAANGRCHVILGNGSCELIYALCHYMAAKNPGFYAFYPIPTFSEYGHAVVSSGGTCIPFKTEETDGYALTDEAAGSMLDTVDESIKKGLPVKLVFICNPNNPTGNLISRDMLEGIALRLERSGIILLVDECFLRFVDSYEDYTMTSVLNDHENVIVLDAFTKFYAMPGLRIGYALCSDKVLLDDIRLTIQPWNVSACAYEAALCALEDRDYAARTVPYVRREREYMIGELKSCGLEVVGVPAADFIFFKGPAGLNEALNSEGIDIRDCSDMMKDYDRDDYYYRIAVMNESDNKTVISRLRRICGHNGQGSSVRIL